MVCYRHTGLINDGRNNMRITLVGSRHFGVTTFNTLRQHGVDIVRVVVHDGEDRLAALPALLITLMPRAQRRNRPPWCAIGIPA